LPGSKRAATANDAATRCSRARPQRTCLPSDRRGSLAARQVVRHRPSV
jgi:hypothetical protein